MKNLISLLITLIFCFLSVNSQTVLSNVVRQSSWYGTKFHGRTMANGKPFDMYAPTAAYNHVPLGTKLRVCRIDDTSRCVEVEVTDRVSKKFGHRLDLSKGAFRLIGNVDRGIIDVEIQKL